MARKTAPRKAAARPTAKRKTIPRKAPARKSASRKSGAPKRAAKALPLPTSKRNTGTSWSAENEKELRALIKGNTPTRVIGLKLGRSEASIRSKVQKLGLSLMPANRSPYNRV